MSRPSLSRDVRRSAAGALACGLAVSAALATQGDPSSAAGPTSGCVGSWQLQVVDEPGAPPIRGLASFHADGTAIYGETAAITSLTPGVPVEYTSPGLGTWRAAPGGCTYHFVVLAADAKGDYSRRSDITGTVVLHGRSFTGPVRIKVSHPKLAGRTLKTSAVGNRITP